VKLHSGTGLALVGTVLIKGQYSLRSARVAIGSDPDNELVIDQPTVSRRHAEVVIRAGIFEICDLGSTNGTFVNNRRIEAPTRIKSGDEIRLGGVRLHARVENQAQPTRIPRTPIVVALLLALSAVSFQFVENWLNLLDGAYSVASHQSPAARSPSSAGPQLTSAANSISLSAPTIRTAPDLPATTKPPVPPSSWLTLLNKYRGLAHLAPVVEDSKLSRADRLHAEYLVRNFPEAIRSGTGFGADAHREDSRRPNYTNEGARAASGSLVNEWEMSPRTELERAVDLSKPYLIYPPSESTTAEWNIDGWISSLSPAANSKSSSEPRGLWHVLCVRSMRCSSRHSSWRLCSWAG
jgi:hypothetical protein